MKTETYPLAVPEDLLGEVREAAKETGLSIADAMRQSMRLGLPKLREQLATLKDQPLSTEEVRGAFSQNSDWDALESAMVRRPVRPPEGQ
jgi:hypothetical protein